MEELTNVVNAFSKGQESMPGWSYNKFIQEVLELHERGFNSSGERVYPQRTFPPKCHIMFDWPSIQGRR
jgi:hypothetical protein